MCTAFESKTDHQPALVFRNILNNMIFTTAIFKILNDYTQVYLGPCLTTFAKNL